MVTFIASIVLLIVGYIVYGKVVERIFGINDQNATPAYTNNDGLDYMPMSWWKASLIQLLNIAGTGPIFGAIMGALYVQSHLYGLLLVVFLLGRYMITFQG